KTQMPILSTQNYSIKNFGHKDYARRAYCSGMGRDRVAANKYHMTFWPLWVTPCSTCEMRYQIYAAMAYGAQGVVCFAYTPNRPNWKPNVDNYNDARDIHRTVADTFGPRVWGMRSPGVYHAPNADTPVTESKPAPGEIIERLETELLASPLVQEKDFYVEGGPHKPTYIMVVDKRTTEKNEDEPKPRTAHVEFGPQIKFVELLGPVTLPAGHIRHIDPAWSVPLELKAAGAAILGVDPPDMKQLLGDSADTYMAIVDRVRDMRQALRDKKIDLTAADKTLAEARSQAKDLAARVADAKPAAGEAAGQRQELVARLAARIDDLSTAIHLPPVETKPAAEPEMEPAPPMKAKKPKHK
ncbi:MAG: hypothetical protein K8T25_03685, partial [Planctomycetia bacterium]|nr:hypothetical protein [Planctomycetia bacterium]